MELRKCSPALQGLQLIGAVYEDAWQVFISILQQAGVRTMLHKAASLSTSPPSRRQMDSGGSRYHWHGRCSRGWRITGEARPDQVDRLRPYSKSNHRTGGSGKSGGRITGEAWPDQ